MVKGAGRTGPERYLDLRGRVGQALRGVSRAKGTGRQALRGVSRAKGTVRTGYESSLG